MSRVVGGLLLAAFLLATPGTAAAPAVAAPPSPVPTAVPPAVPPAVPTPAPTVAIPAPSPTPAQNALRGVASWFAAPVGTAAAGPALRRALGPHWRGRTVTVCVTDGAGVQRCARARLTDWCGCYGVRLIDLSRSVFELLGPPSRGLLRVVVRW